MIDVKIAPESSTVSPQADGSGMNDRTDDEGYKLKVSMHDRNQVEIKLFAPLQSALEAPQSLTVDIRITVPRSLGSISKDVLLGMVNILDRVGFEQEVYLDEIINSLNSWRVSVRRNLGNLLLERAQSTDATTTRFAEFERETRILGCLLKSAIRDHAKRLQDPNSDVKQYQSFGRLIKVLKGLVDDVASLSFEEGIPLQVAKILEEYALLNVEQACSELAHMLPEGTECQSAAIDCALEACQRLASTEADNERGRPLRKERYSARYHELKYYFISPLYLRHKQQGRSYVVHDIIGMLAAGTAMIVWVMIMWASELEIGRYNSTVFIVFIFGYILKDRIKEWGKRYFIPLLKQPDKHLKLLQLDKAGTKHTNFGCVREWYKSREDLYSTLVPPSALPIQPGRISKQPETVLNFRREVALGTKVDLDGFYLKLGDLYEINHVQVIRFDFSTIRMVMKAPNEVIKLVDLGTRHAVSLDCLQEYTFKLSATVTRQLKGRCCNLKRKSSVETVCEKEVSIRIDATGIKGVQGKKINQ